VVRVRYARDHPELAGLFERLAEHHEAAPHVARDDLGLAVAVEVEQAHVGDHGRAGLSRPAGSGWRENVSRPCPSRPGLGQRQRLGSASLRSSARTARCPSARGRSRPRQRDPCRAGSVPPSPGS
jgi:hypothetical protein